MPRQVHYATGMVAAQAICSVEAALDLLVACAVQHGSGGETVAADVVNRRLRLGD